MFAGVSLLALSPLLWAMWRRSVPRGRRDSALALHRAQLVELDRELGEGRIGAVEHAAARLEVERRLLAVAETAETVSPAPRGRLPAMLVLSLVLVPLAAEALYLIDGQPQLPSGVAVVNPNAAQEEADAEKLITTLRARLGELDPKTEIAGQGYLLLGNAEAGRGHMGEAAAAWRTALEAGFSPGLAAQAAEAQFQADGKMSAETAALYRRALAEAPPTASWKALVQQRLSAAP